MRRVFLIALILLLTSVAYRQTPVTHAQAPATTQTPQTNTTVHLPKVGESSLEVRQKTFEYVWKTVKEKHFDPTFGGVDWDKIHTLYAPKVDAVKSDQELYQVLETMLGELHQSHFAITSPDDTLDEERAEKNAGDVGIDLTLVDNEAVITRVDADSPAAKAGIQTGFAITKIDDYDVTKLSERIQKLDHLMGLKEIYFSRIALARINGEADSKVTLTYLNKENKSQEVTLKREKPKGELSPSFANLPEIYLKFEKQRLANNIGYIRFNIFLIPMMPKIRAAIREMKDISGLIIDLRGNPGGIGGMSAGIAGMLTDQMVTLGTMNMRTGHINFVGYPQEGAFLGPVVIIMDGRSASTSEVFASGMQELGRARVVGQKSAGAALPSVIEKLPTGALFQYATADFKTPKGILIEGRGVIPDIEVKLTRANLYGNRDPQLEAAITEIDKINTQKKSNTVEK